MTGITLHIWPGSWDLPSVEPSCLATIFYLQHTIPGKFSIVESGNPDASPTAQFPFLVHGERTIPTFALIIKYVASLKDIRTGSLDASLGHARKSQEVAWCAHVESNLGDVVYYNLYAHHGNWAGLTQPVLASMLPVPQCYFVPGRIRECHRSRLETAGLWLPEVEKQDKKTFRETFKSKKEKTDTHLYLQAFQRERVMEKARASLDVYTRLLGANDFFFSDRPTTLDIVLAANTLLLLNPPYPDPFLQALLIDSYPALSSHARRVYAHAMRSGSPTRSTQNLNFSWSSLIPWPPVTKKQAEKSSEDVHYDRMRWGFYGLAIGSVAAYLAVVGGSKFEEILAIVARASEEEEEEEAVQAETSVTSCDSLSA